MNAYQNLKNKIVNTLELECEQVMADLINVLDYVVAGDTYNSYEDNMEIVFSDRDVLDNQDEVKEDTKLWEEVRELQHEIVNTFSEQGE